MRRAPTAVVAAVALAAAAAGCGGDGGDLFAVDRAGDVPGAQLRLIVKDVGTVSCNGAQARRMPEGLLLDARELQRDLVAPAKRRLSLQGGANSVLRYDVRTSDGQVRFADDSPGPRVLDRLAYFVRRTAKDVCDLPR
jgi:hypothetical protein